MSNQMIPTSQVGKHFLDFFHGQMAKSFPSMIKDSKEYNEMLAQLMGYCLGGLQRTPMVMG